MAKLTTPAQTAEALSVPERLLLLCVACGIDFKHAKIAERLATEAVMGRAAGSALGDARVLLDGLSRTFPRLDDTSSERLHRELGRRIKTQPVLSSVKAAANLSPPPWALRRR